MEIRLASVPRDSGHIFPRPLEAIHKPGDSSVMMDVHISRKRRGLVLITVYRLEVPCIYKEIRLPSLLNKGKFLVS
jgi:hypothetical protein